MALIGTKLRSLSGSQVAFRCPGCQEHHAIPVGAGDGPHWNWNGDGSAPTFTPSILVRTIRAPRAAEQMTKEEEDEYDAIYAAGGREAVFASRFGWICHSFVTAGKIKFLGDCTHALAGQTVDLPDMQAD